MFYNFLGSTVIFIAFTQGTTAPALWTTAPAYMRPVM